MVRIRETIVGLLLALSAVAATPSTASTFVKFSFNAGATPVKGVFTLDCPPGSGPCAIQSVTGVFGSTPITAPQPLPALPSGISQPDNLLTPPHHQPTANGADFWTGDIVFILTEDQVLQLQALAIEEQQVTYLNEYLVTDYHAGVPEPAAWALTVAGLGLVGAALRRRRAPAIA